VKEKVAEVEEEGSGTKEGKASTVAATVAARKSCRRPADNGEIARDDLGR
jgi:hypothetical protein